MTTTTHSYQRPQAMDTGQAARYLGVHPNTIRRWDKAGALKSWRTPGGQRRFNLQDLQALKAGAR